MERERAHSHRLRRGRFSEPGRSYLITTTTHLRQPLFRDFTAGRIVVSALHREHHTAATLCYVLMPDHLHWLLALQRGAMLCEVVQRVKSISAHRIARLIGRSGPVWQAGYHDHAVRREADIRRLARYVVANPLRAGLVESLGDYPLWDACWI